MYFSGTNATEVFVQDFGLTLDWIQGDTARGVFLPFVDSGFTCKIAYLVFGFAGEDFQF